LRKKTENGGLTTGANARTGSKSFTQFTSWVYKFAVST